MALRFPTCCNILLTWLFIVCCILAVILAFGIQESRDPSYRTFSQAPQPPANRGEETHYLPYDEDGAVKTGKVVMPRAKTMSPRNIDADATDAR